MRRWVALGVAVVVAAVGLRLIAGLLLSAHHAPAPFALSSVAPSQSGASLAGRWQIAAGSEAGYRAREKFINQAATTEAVARTSQVSGGFQVEADGGGTYTLSAIDFRVDLASLTSQDRYAIFQTYQRDFFVQHIYLETSVYPTAEFRAPPVKVTADELTGQATISVNGELTVHGATKSVVANLKAQLNGSQIEVVGSIAVDMRDFGIDPPDISFTKAEPGLVIEFQLFLSRA